MSAALEACAEIVAKRGYLIIATCGPRRIGHIETAYDGRTMEQVDQPLRIVRETTRSDYDLQTIAMGEDPLGLHPRDAHYYIVESD